jgi:diphthamide synthase (EF-2-diphthine--ammonia ligase)
LASLFPLWGRATADVASDFVSAGFRAITTCVDTAKLAECFLGRDFDAALLAELPPEVDRCGENGEFHTFAYGGPVFTQPLAIETGERVRRGRFAFCDVLLTSPPGAR